MSSSLVGEGERGRPRVRVVDFDFLSAGAFFAELDAFGGRPRPRPVPLNLVAARLLPPVLALGLLVAAFDDEAASSTRRRLLRGGGGLGSGCCTQRRSPPMSQ